MAEVLDLSNLPRFGACCALVSGSDAAGIPVTGGQQYWVILKTDATQLDTVDAWNVDDTDQVYPRRSRSFPVRTTRVRFSRHARTSLLRRGELKQGASS